MTIDQIRHWQDHHSEQLFDIEGVVGVGVTWDQQGGYLLSVHLEHDSDEVRARVDELLGAIPHRFLVTGTFRLLGS